MSIVEITSPTGLVIECIEGPQRPVFAQLTTAGLAVGTVDESDLTDNERRVFGLDGGAA